MNATAFADQYDAAVRDAARTLDKISILGTGALPNAAARPDAWITAKALAVLLSMSDGTARVCRHLGPSPRRAHAALWSPGRVVCPLCVPTLRPATAMEDSTCDQCRRLVTRIHSCATTVGPIVLAFGLCTRCLPTNTDATPPKETDQ